MTTATQTPMLLHIFGGALGINTSEPLQWLVLLVMLVLLVAPVVLARRAGRSAESRSLLGALGAGVRRYTGLPAWSGAGVFLGVWSLTTGFIGFMWDVAWHADLGRDRQLFTVPHTLILLALAGIGVAGVLSIIFATRERATVAWRIGRLRVPAGAAALVALSAAGVIAFPLDDLWHATYGIDVTMWSPTHLCMIGSASLAPLAVALLLWEARPRPTLFIRIRQVFTMGAVLIGLSTFQLEFDMGIPQWQQLFHPLLIAIAAGFALTAARALLGRWGALQAVAVFLVIRGLMALLIGPMLGHTLPHFPLYIAEALCVELAFVAARRDLTRALLCGVLIGTVGMAAEWGWTQVWGLQPWQPRLLTMMWVPLLAAVLASLLGMSFACNLLAREGRRPLLTRPLALAAMAAIAGLMAVPMPRTAAPATVAITDWRVSPMVPTIDRNGDRVTTFDLAVTVRTDPANAADGADWFRVAAWQGGGIVNARLVETAPGVYVADRSVPAGGNWKVMVELSRGSTLAAAPVVMPAEPDQGLPAIPLKASRTAPLDNAELLLLRENHAAAPFVADAAYAIFAITIVGWLVVLSSASRRIAPRSRPRAPTVALTAA